VVGRETWSLKKPGGGRGGGGTGSLRAGNAGLRRVGTEGRGQQSFSAPFSVSAPSGLE